MATIIEYFVFPTVTLITLLVLALAGVLDIVPLGVCGVLMLLYAANIWHKLLNNGRGLLGL
jgi:hypothetical protein